MGTSPSSSLVILGRARKPQLPFHLEIMRVNNRYAYNHSGPVWPFCSLLLVQYLINYMRNSILYYKIGFVLDSFAQLQAKISVLSTFKV